MSGVCFLKCLKSTTRPNIQKFHVLSMHCIYMYFMDLRKDTGNLCVQHN